MRKLKKYNYGAKRNKVHSSGLTREEKRRLRYTDHFNEIFWFFLKSYRCKILDFCGSEVLTRFDKSGKGSKYCFKGFDNGIYSKEEIFLGIKTFQPNTLKGVIIGKKSWGLWKNEWSSGISEGLFTKEEIVNEFTKHNIKIPDSLMLDFDNTIHKKKYSCSSPFP